jgi:hypothetical protein
VTIGRKRGQRPIKHIRVFIDPQGIPQPGNDIAALTRRAAKQCAVTINAIAPETGGHMRYSWQRDAQCSGGADRQRSAGWSAASAADTGGRAITNGGKPRHVCQFRPARRMFREQPLDRNIPIHE